MTRLCDFVVGDLSSSSFAIAAPVPVIVLRVRDAAQAARGADVSWPRWRLIQHHPDRLLLLGLRRRGEIVQPDLRPAYQAREQVTVWHWHQRHVVGGLKAALEIVGHGRAHRLSRPVLLRCDVSRRPPCGRVPLQFNAAVDGDRPRSRRLVFDVNRHGPRRRKCERR